MNLLPVVALTASLMWIGAVEHEIPDPEVLSKTGDVALDNWPYCDFFVIRTGEGFSLALWQSGMWIFGEGDDVYGPATQVGRQSILLAGTIMSGQMTIKIEAVGVSLAAAQAAFYKRCKVR